MKLHTLATLLFTGSLLSVSTYAATTTIYKSIGKHGEVRYSQTQPSDTKNFETIEMRSDGRTSNAGQTANLPDPATPPANSDAQRIADLEKQVKDQKDAELANRCNAMRTNLANLSTGGRMYETKPDGTRAYLNDQEISSKKQQITDALSKYCQ